MNLISFSLNFRCNNDTTSSELCEYYIKTNCPLQMTSAIAWLRQQFHVFIPYWFCPGDVCGSNHGFHSILCVVSQVSLSKNFLFVTGYPLFLPRSNYRGCLFYPIWQISRDLVDHLRQYKFERNVCIYIYIYIWGNFIVWSDIPYVLLKVYVKLLTLLL